MADDLPLALSVEKVRHEMMRGILVPRELVNAALATTAAKLKAKETKFFTYKGRVTQQTDVEDHGSQLAAADQIYSLAGLYSRERDMGVATPSVALEVDPHTGVIRLVVGSSAPLALPSQTQEEVGESERSAAEAPVVELAPVGRRKARVPDEVWRIVSDEVVD